MKKLILIASLLMAGGLWAEQMVCTLKTSSFDDMDSSLQDCKAGDVINWQDGSFGSTRHIVSMYCHQEKQITVTSTLSTGSTGVCTYTGKKLEYR